MPWPSDSGIALTRARVSNFRSIQSVEVELDDLILLIGENNSGKTAFLEAVNLSIGAFRRHSGEQDIFIAATEKKPPQDRSAIIDLVIQPVDTGGKFLDAFPKGSPWLECWGNGIVQDAEGKEFVFLRSRLHWSATRGEYTITRSFLKEWPVSMEKLEQAKLLAEKVLPNHIEPLTLYFLDAKRDMQDELRNKSSFWSRLISDIGLPEEKVTEFEETLSLLNAEVVNNSDVLKHVLDHLNELHKSLSGGGSAVSIAPLAREIGDLQQGLEILFTTENAHAMPLVRHGMGTRSLAAVLTFRAYTTWKREEKGGGANHAMLALEEPEAHLHPQAQRTLFAQVAAIPGQKLISSHSPYVASQCEIEKIRHFRKAGPATLVSRIDTSLLDSDEIRQINRTVMNTRGDLLFARAVVLFEGETEEQALPIFAEGYWRKSIHSLGLSFVPVGGTNYAPFVILAASFAIPWFLFSDGEADALKAVKSSCERIGITDYTKAGNISAIPDGLNFENFLLVNGYAPEIEVAIEKVRGANFVDGYIADLDGQKRKGGGIRDYKTEGRDRALLDMMRENKTEFASPIAREIVSLKEEERRIPSLLKNFFDKIHVPISSSIKVS